MLRNWRAVQKDAADARLLRELQLMHQASLHHREMLGLRSLHGWAEAAAASREEAAAQARKDATWDKIQQWLAEDTGRGTSSEAILAPPFLQVVSYASPSPNKLIDTISLHMQTTLYYGRLPCIPHIASVLTPINCMLHVMPYAQVIMLCRTCQVQHQRQTHCLLV